MIVKLYHDEEDNVDEAVKQSDMPTLRVVVSIAASAGHRWSRSAYMWRSVDAGGPMREFREAAAAAA